MNTRNNVARRLDKEISNAGVPPQGNQVHPIEEDANDNQAPVNPPPFKNGNIRVVFIQISQAITTQVEAVTTQAQAMTD